MPRQTVGPHAAEEEERDHRRSAAPSSTRPRSVGRAVQRLQHGERERDRRHRAAEPRRSSGRRRAGGTPARGAGRGGSALASPSNASCRATTARTARRGRRDLRPRLRPRARRRRTSCCSIPSRTRAAQRSSSSSSRSRCAVDVFVHAEVDQRQPLGLAPLIAAIGRVPALDVDVGRRRDREHVGRAGHAHTGGVAGEQRSVAEVADVVRRVPERRERSPSRARRRSRRARSRSGTGASSPQSASNALAVEPPRRALEARRVDEVRRADLRDPDRQAGVARGRAFRRRPRGRGGCARAADGGCPSSRGRARRARPRARAASRSGRSRRARGRRSVSTT